MNSKVVKLFKVLYNLVLVALIVYLLISNNQLKTDIALSNTATDIKIAAVGNLIKELDTDFNQHILVNHAWFNYIFKFIGYPDKDTETYLRGKFDKYEIK